MSHADSDNIDLTGGPGASDVAVAVSNLRNDLSAGSAQWNDKMVIQCIHDAVKVSPDGGNTLDMGKKGIQSIGDEAVEVLVSGVGKGLQGACRCVWGSLIYIIANGSKAGAILQ
jgi:hypothetical protein